jgi:hypothetical protein
MKMTAFWDVTQCILVEFTDVSEVLAASIVRAMSTYVGELVPNYTAQHPIRQSSSTVTSSLLLLVESQMRTRL